MDWRELHDRHRIEHISLTWFQPTLAQKLPGGFDSMDGAPALIIDLRVNPGGMRDIAISAAGHMVKKRNLCSTLTRRGGTSEIDLEPTGGGYSGPLVVIIDVISKSSLYTGH